MQELHAFIDLNTYRLTNAILANIYEYCQKYQKVYYSFYNYSCINHKSLPLNGAKFPVVHGRRKVQIDLRIMCDSIEYACKTPNANILLLCGIVDSLPLFKKFKELNACATLATMQKVDVGANNYLILYRQEPVPDLNKDVAPILDKKDKITSSKKVETSYKKPISAFYHKTALPPKKTDTQYSTTQINLANQDTNLIKPISAKADNFNAITNSFLHNADSVTPKTLLTIDNLALNTPVATDDYDAKLQELNMLINKLKF